jgi:ADP-heptose:LPS heptosyltransferase
MKTLAICLLRIGDILMCAPALKALKERDPQQELHILVNAEFEFCKELLDYVDCVHIFPRRRLQESLGDVDDPILLAYDELKVFVETLQKEAFEEVYNFTQNKLSAYLSASLHVAQTFGMHGSAENDLQINGQWFRYLNQSPNDVHLHFSEVFQRAVGVAELSTLTLKETKSGIAEANRFFNQQCLSKNCVAFQIFSNETRKMLPHSFWCELAIKLAGIDANTSFVILAAPWEQESANQLALQIRERRLDAHVFVCSFATALSTLKRMSRLVTVDTSIKHLACATGIPIIELAIGGSDPRHTGPFVDGAWVIQSSENEIDDSLLAGTVAQLTHGQIKNYPFSVEQTRLVDGKTWFLEELNDDFALRKVDRILSHALSLSSIAVGDVDSSVSVGDLGLSLAEEISHFVNPCQKQEVLTNLQHKENELHDKINASARLQNGFKNIFSEKVHQLDWIEDAKDILPSEEMTALRNQDLDSSVVPIFTVRKVQSHLAVVHQQSNWNLKLIRTIRTHLMEII